MRKFLIFIFFILTILFVYNKQKVQTPSLNPNISENFICGYNDGQKQVWTGTIQWTFNNEYRQGHLLGLNDKKKGIKRFK